MNLRKICCGAILCLLCALPAQAGVLSGDGIGAYGDSLSWQYSMWVPAAKSFGYNLFSNGTQFNWVDHLVKSGYNFGAKVDGTGEGKYFYNEYDVALGGAVSGDLPGQVSQLLPYVQSNAVKLTVLGIGGNNFTAGVGNEYPTIYNAAAKAGYNPLADPAVQTFINTLVGDITTAVNDTLAANPNERIILMNVPDLGDTSSYRTTYSSATRRAAVTTVVNDINQKILDFANQHHMPVVDLAGLGHLGLTPPTIAGVTMLSGGGNGGNRMYLSDGFHPGTVANGLLANAILTANHVAYGDPVNLISDQTIVTRAGLTPKAGGATYYNVSPYVLFTPVPEPSTVMLVALAGACLGVRYVHNRSRAVL